MLNIVDDPDMKTPSAKTSVEIIDMERREVLLKTGALQNAILNSANFSSIATDEKGVIQIFNIGAERMLGYASADVLNKVTPAAISDPDEVIARAVALSLELSTNISPGFEALVYKASRGIEDIYELTYVRKDGSRIPAIVSVTALRDEGEQIIGYLLIGTDNTARKLAEEEHKKLDHKLRDLQYYTRSLIESNIDAIMTTDIFGIILDVNKQTEVLTGCTRVELIGSLCKSHFTNSKRAESGIKLVLSEKTVSNYELIVRSRNGNTTPVSFNATTMYDRDRKLQGVFVAARDVTERHKTLEQLRSSADELALSKAQVEAEHAQLAARVEERTTQLQYANHAKDSFLATMSHEIRTPLGGLMGMMELLGLSHLDDQQREMLEAARSSGKSLLRIVNDILDWSKIEAGKLELAPQVASIHETLKSVAKTYLQLTAEKDIQLKIKVDPDLSSPHIFDPLRLSQILNNFTSNALKFTERGTIEISAQRIDMHTCSEQVRFSVKDTGIGIDQAHRSRLFQHYEQASADTARMYGGTGLGLAISRRLAELMGGTLSVESAFGVGSTFSFTVNLPVASLTAKRNLQMLRTTSQIHEAEPSIRPLAAHGQHISILIVDDHPLNRMLLKQQLGMLGLQVEAAESGIPALALWQNHTPPFDLVITDCHMPEMDGYELTRRIRASERQSGAKRIPIIAWTANVLAEEEVRCQMAGMDDVLTKPTELSDLRANLLVWLVKHGVISQP